MTFTLAHDTENYFPEQLIYFSNEGKYCEGDILFFQDENLRKETTFKIGKIINDVPAIKKGYAIIVLIEN